MKLVGYRTSESGMSAIRSREAGKLSTRTVWLHMQSSLSGHYHAHQHEGSKEKGDIDVKDECEVRPQKLYSDDDSLA